MNAAASAVDEMRWELVITIEETQYVLAKFRYHAQAHDFFNLIRDTYGSLELRDVGEESRITLWETRN